VTYRPQFVHDLYITQTDNGTLTFFPFNPSFLSVEIVNAFYIIVVVVVVIVVVGGGAGDDGDGFNSRDLKA